MPEKTPILHLRGQSVIIDAILDRLFGVETGASNQSVRCTPKRFPQDFAVALNAEERTWLITNCDQLRQLKFPRAPRELHDQLLPLLQAPPKADAPKRRIGFDPDIVD